MNRRQTDKNKKIADKRYIHHHCIPSPRKIRDRKIASIKCNESFAETLFPVCCTSIYFLCFLLRTLLLIPFVSRNIVILGARVFFTLLRETINYETVDKKNLSNIKAH